MKVLVFLLVGIISPYSLFCQASEYEGSNVKFGFSFGMNKSYSEYVLTDWNNSSYNLKDSVSYISNGDKMGFRLGLVMDAEISSFFRVCPKIELSFNSNEIIFHNTDDSETSISINPVTAEFIMHFVLIHPEWDKKPFIFIGPNLKVPTLKDGSFKTKSYDLALDVGIGLEKVFPNFTVAPEIRYSRGLIEVNEDFPGYYNSAFESVTARNNFSLVFVFKG